MTNAEDVAADRLRADDGRSETEAERIDRNLAELLQELRVAIIGAQVLFGFLLSIPFTTRFARLDASQRWLYSADLLLAAFATALLVGPVAYHRLRFRDHAKATILRTSNALAIAGLLAVALAMAGSVLLVMTLLWDGAVPWLVTVPTMLTIFGLWFAIPAGKHRPDDY